MRYIIQHSSLLYQIFLARLVVLRVWAVSFFIFLLPFVSASAINISCIAFTVTSGAPGRRRTAWRAGGGT